MTFVLKTRQWILLTVASVVAGLCAGGFAEVDVPLPLVSVAGMPQPVLPALGFVIVLSACMNRAEVVWSLASVRNPVAHSHAIMFGALAVTIALGVVSSGFSVDNGLVVARDFAGLVALALVGRLLFGGRYAALVPVMYVVVAAAFARDRLGDIRAWCWIVDRDMSNPWGWATCCCGVLAALIYQARRAPIFE